MKILFLNSAPIIKYGLKLGFDRNGWDTDFLTVPEENEECFRRKLDSFKPDYVLVDGGINKQGWIFPVVKELGLKMIYWGIEDPVWLDSLSKEYAEHSVLVATTCIESLPTYETYGTKAICVPFAIDPCMHRNMGVIPKYKKLDAVFVGNNYNYYDNRYQAYLNVLQPFIDLDLKFEIYGYPEWVDPDFRFSVPERFYKGFLPMEESLFMYSNAKFVLGVHSIIDSETMQSMRTFEVLGCRGFFLSSYTKSIESMFTNHTHLVYSKSAEETAELIKYYKDKDDLRRKIAIEGQQLVYEKHTYEQRAKDIIEALEV